MASEIAIRVVDLHKRYQIFGKPEDRMKQMVMPQVNSIFGREQRQYFSEFDAVRGVSLDVRRGETVGIVGRNGSGKSTLLQMICGTLQPTHGSVEVRGRIAALLELGAGFNPEFTGRENVFLNAAILGLSHAETVARFNDIAAFADIGQFIDQPVKIYSSGMFVRLAFAVAINVEPDILIVDEALAVGDESFQRKCYARIEGIRERGGTILFVSHGSQTVIQLCDRAILLDRGEKILDGEPKTVVQSYQRLLNLSGEAAEIVRNEIKNLSTDVASNGAFGSTTANDQETQNVVSISKSWFDPGLLSSSVVEYPSIGARISNVHITDQDGRKVNCLHPNEKFNFVYNVHFERDFENVAFAMFVKTITGFELAGRHSHPQSQGVSVVAGQTVRVVLPFNCNFLPSVYACNCGVFLNLGSHREILHRYLDIILFRVTSASSDDDRQGIFDLCPERNPSSITTYGPEDESLEAAQMLSIVR